MEAKIPNFPSAEETLSHPAYPSAVWALEPHQSGHLPVAKDRGGPVNIAWEIHGDGPTKIALVMGLAGIMATWQRQTRYFGHEHGDRYSVLLVDNRGMGASDKPLSRYSTSGMAADFIEVLDHVGWTEPRSVHLAGISLGGMIAQEMACVIPDRLASLSLLCSSSSVRNTTSFSGWAAERLAFLFPKSPEQTIIDTARKMFPDEWLALPDDVVPPSPETTPRCGPAPGDGVYRKFDTNFQRYQAQEMTKKRRPGAFTMQGLLCQLSAVQFHHKSPEQLRSMADAVGRERILVMHGTRDKVLIPSNGELLMKLIEPGTSMMLEGVGHAPVLQRTAWFNQLLDDKIQEWSKM